MLTPREAQQIVTAILYSESPLVGDTHGQCRRLRAIYAILDTYIDGAYIDFKEDGKGVLVSVENYEQKESADANQRNERADHARLDGRPDDQDAPSR